MGCGHSEALSTSPQVRKTLADQQKTLKMMEKKLGSLTQSLENMNKETLALAIEKCAADDQHVSYDRLSVESDKGCHCGEEVKYLLHDSQTAENMFGTSKFNAQPGPGGSVTVTIEVEGDPV